MVTQAQRLTRACLLPSGGFCWPNRLGEDRHLCPLSLVVNTNGPLDPLSLEVFRGCLLWPEGRDAGFQVEREPVLPLFALGTCWPLLTAAWSVVVFLSCSGQQAADHPSTGLFPVCLLLRSLSTSAA